MKKFQYFVFLLSLTIGLPSTVSASVKLSGTLTAKESCEAYVSKRKKTNPDNQRLKIGQIYSVIAANRQNNPHWFRIRIDGSRLPERWVHKDCGTLKLNSPQPLSSRPVCQMPGHQTTQVLALSWQPAFCETHRYMAECKIKDAKAYQASHFTLHGLWPNWEKCQPHYQFCDAKVSQKAKTKCGYPPIRLSRKVRHQLGVVMPSLVSGTCLQRHEWWKHGTCSGWNADTYFTVSTRLTKEFNEAGIAAFMKDNLGKRVRKKTFLSLIDRNFGAKARQLVKLSCNKRSGNLTEIQILLPAKIAENDSLASLIKKQRAGNQSMKYSGNCPAYFRIDPIND
jgi:ribonuclease T2